MWSDTLRILSQQDPFQHINLLAWFDQQECSAGLFFKNRQNWTPPKMSEAPNHSGVEILQDLGYVRWKPGKVFLISHSDAQKIAFLNPTKSSRQFTWESKFDKHLFQMAVWLEYFNVFHRATFNLGTICITLDIQTPCEEVFGRQTHTQNTFSAGIWKTREGKWTYSLLRSSRLFFQLPARIRL